MVPERFFTGAPFWSGVVLVAWALSKMLRQSRTTSAIVGRMILEVFMILLALLVTHWHQQADWPGFAPTHVRH